MMRLACIMLMIGLNLASAATTSANRSHTLDSNLVKSNWRRNTFKCFVCYWSQNDEPCGDDEFRVSQSSPGQFMINCLACYKQVFYQASGLKRQVLRGCAQELPHYALTCQSIFNQDGSFMETCACSTPYCNSAPTPIFNFHIFWCVLLALKSQLY